MKKSLFIVIAIAISIAINAVARESTVTLNLGGEQKATVKVYQPGYDDLNFALTGIGYSSWELSTTDLTCYYDQKKIEITGISYTGKTVFLITYKDKESGIICSEIFDLEDEYFTKWARAQIKESYLRENGNAEGFDQIKLIHKVKRIVFYPLK